MIHKARSRFFLRLVSGAVIGGSLAMASGALACGGFWCSQTAPVEQTREEILFVENGDGTTTCVVRIQYQGPSEKFAWVLPVTGVPEIGVGSSDGFRRLGYATAPQYVVEQHVEGTCIQEPSYIPGAGGASSYPGGYADGGAAPPSIDVLASGSVGPYDYVVIHPNPDLSAPAAVAIDWLVKEGFDITGVSADVLGPYLADGQNLVAFRLTKGTDVGAIKPVSIRYSGDLPSIPIRPTAVAAQDDMGVLVYIAAKAQAVPRNYRSLVLNEALIDWFNPTPENYEAVVTAAANQAGGQGFVTELAQPTANFENLVFSSDQRASWNELKAQAFPEAIDAIWAANNLFRDLDGWREAIEAAVTLPAGTSFDDFGRNPDALRGVPGFAVDLPLFFSRLEADIVQPLSDMQALLDSRPYLTRLYTTMSPGDMTDNPSFSFNPDLAVVSNLHTAQMYLECNPLIHAYDAPYRLELPQGGTVRGNGTTAWPFSPTGPLPANRKIVQLSEAGSGQVVTDNTADIGKALQKLGGAANPPPVFMGVPMQGMPIGGFNPPPPPDGANGAGDGKSAGGASGTSKDDDGCAVSSPSRGAGQGTVPALLALAAAFATSVVRRRRRM